MCHCSARQVEAFLWRKRTGVQNTLIMNLALLTGLCSTVLPQTHADLCDPQAYYGEITDLLFTRLGDNMTDWTSPTEWTTRLSNTTALPSSPTLAPIRRLFGIGGFGAPEQPKVRISRKRDLYGTRTFTMTFKVDDTGSTNWTWMKTIPASRQTYAVWFATEQRMWGGNSGIEAVVVANPDVPESNEEVMKITVTVTWKSTIPEINDNILP